MIIGQGIAAAAVLLLALSGPAVASVPEPDNIIYGLVTADGVPLDQGEVTVSLNGGEEILASFALGSDPRVGDRYVLRVPLDALAPQAAGTARPGDVASIFVDGELSGTVEIGSRGTVIELGLETCYAKYALYYKDSDGDGYSDGASLTACERPGGYRLPGELTALAGDCADGDPLVNPGVAEVCDGIDNDCDGLLDECDCPDIHVSPAAFAFPALAAGSFSGTQAFTATNLGGNPLEIHDVTLAGDDYADYLEVEDDCSGVTLATGEQCTVRVAFAPSAGGDTSAEVSFLSSDLVKNPLAVPLTGTADGDPDGDGVPYGDDNCPGVLNPGQEDADGDGYGDLCDDLPGVSDPDQGGMIDLARTGQEASYQAGDDGQIRAGVIWPDPRFTDPGGAAPLSEGVGVDQLTGLMWLRNANCIKTAYPDVDDDGTVSWAAALSFVAGLNDGTFADCNQGYRDWRLPNVVEMESLQSAGKANSRRWLIDGAGFRKVTGKYWTSTAAAFTEDRAWVVNLGKGSVVAKPRQKAAGAVWPVRDLTRSPAPLRRTGQQATLAAGDDGDVRTGVFWPQPRLSDGADGTYKDELSGLVWPGSADTPGPEACGPGETLTWKKALKHVECLNAANYLGYDDWRLPNRAEMESLVNRGAGENATWIESLGISGARRGFYWTSSSFARDDSRAWALKLGTGVVVPKEKAEKLFFVWPVRGGVLAPEGE